MYLGVMLITIFLGIGVYIALSMITNHFAKIQKEMVIYNDRSKYKTSSSIDLLHQLIVKYTDATVNSKYEIDVNSLVKCYIYEKKIGKFNYDVVERGAVLGLCLMWGIVLGSIALARTYNDTLRQETTIVIYLGASLVVCLLTTGIYLFKGIREQRERLIIKLQDYLINIYPVEVYRNHEEKSKKLLQARVNRLEHELEEYKKTKEEEVDQEEKIESKQEIKEDIVKDVYNLKEKDIIRVLKKVDR